MEPPKGTDVTGMVADATGVKRMVDAFVVPEMNNAVMRLSSLGGALLLQSKGLETVMQVCCRDRNRLALQGDLLAAQALGVPNVMAVTGDEITHGDHHQAKAVYDLGSPGTARRHANHADRTGPGRGGPQRGAQVPGGLHGQGDHRCGALMQELADLDRRSPPGPSFTHPAGV